MNYKELVKFHKGLAHKLRKGKGFMDSMKNPMGDVSNFVEHERLTTQGPMRTVPKEMTRDMTGGMVKRPLKYRL